MIFFKKIKEFKGEAQKRVERKLDQAMGRLQYDLQQATPLKEAEIATAWRVEHSGDTRRIVNDHAGILDLEYGTENRAPAAIYRSALAAFSRNNRGRS